MPRYHYSARSQSRLDTCDPDLVLLFNEVIADPACPCDITILEGHRSHARQAELYAQGRTTSGPRVTNAKPGQSAHNSQPSKAVDAAPYLDTDGDGDSELSWDWDDYHPLADFIKAKWAALKRAGRVTGTLIWGGDWKKTRADGPHWEVRR